MALRRRQQVSAIVVVALLIAAGLLWGYVRAGRVVSRQVEGAVAQQARGFEKLREVDPALVKWREALRIELGTRAAKSLAVDPAGNLYVLDGTNLRVWSLTKPDALPTVTPSQADLVDCDGGELWGITAASLKDGLRSFVTDVERLGGVMWIADSGRRVIRRVAKDGTVTEIGKGWLLAPSPHLELALKPDGNALVPNPGRLRVETYSPEGKLLSYFGRPGSDIEGFSGCCNPIDVALLPDGRIVTAEKGLPRVKVYTAEGALESVVATPADLSRQAIPQLATTAEGKIVVLDAKAGVVKVFAPAGL